MKYTTFFASLVFLLLCSCAVAPKTRFTVDPFSLKYPASTVDAQSDKLLTDNVGRKAVTVSYLPDEDAVCLEYRVDFVTYYQYWNRLGREVFITALERYKKDYDQRTLKTKSGRKERIMYGTVSGYLAWQSLGFLSDLAQGPTKLDMGYSFKGSLKSKTPYFAISQNEAIYQDREQGGHERKSPRVMLYFTRAQADELVALFDQEYLWSLSPAKPKSSNDVAVDEY